MVKPTMTGERLASSLDVISDSSLVNSSGNGGSKIFIHHITVHKLNDKNYLQGF